MSITQILGEKAILKGALKDKTMSTAIQKQANDNMDVVTITRQGIKDLYITLRPKGEETFPSMLNSLNYLLQEQNAQVVKFDVFAPIHEFNAHREILEKVDYPVTWVEGNSCFQNRIAGIQVHAVSGTLVNTMFLDDKPIARVFEDDFAKYCILGNVLPKTSSASNKKQAWDTLEKMEKVLNPEKMDTSNVVRTWFYNNNITSWYDEFNAVRNKFFKQKGLLDKWLPASTGVGGENPFHAALVASALAIQAKKKDITVQEVLSPMQPPAPKYGSSFSRAIEIVMPDHRCILISGTASIATSGKTAHLNNVNKQLALTMKVVETILLSRCMNFSNVVRATAYFKHAEDALALNKYGKNCEKAIMPIIITHNDLCRDNLLFEIEVDAIAKT